MHALLWDMHVQFSILSKMILFWTYHQGKAKSLWHWCTQTTFLICFGSFLIIHNCPEWQMWLEILWNMPVTMDIQFETSNKVCVSAVFVHICWFGMGRKTPKSHIDTKGKKKPNKLLSGSFNLSTSSLESPWLHFPVFRNQGLGIV